MKTKLKYLILLLTIALFGSCKDNVTCGAVTKVGIGIDEATRSGYNFAIVDVDGRIVTIKTGAVKLRVGQNYCYED